MPLPLWKQAEATLLDPSKPWLAAYREHGSFVFNDKRLRVTFVVMTPGPEFEKPINLFMNVVGRNGQRPSRSSTIRKVFEHATGLIAPENLARMEPSVYLADSEFEITVRTVDRDSDGISVPSDARYSVVHKIRRRTAGMPPVLRARHGIGQRGT